MAEAAASNNGSKKKLMNLEELDPTMRGCVDKLLEIQREHDKLEAEFREKKAQLVAKHRALCGPLYDKRHQIVHREGVPDFWLNAMKNHADMSEEITDRDEAALISLEEIKCSYFHDDDDQKKSGFKLEFFFYPNPYFGNSVLTKTYHLSYEQDDELVLESATGTEIEWYQGKCLTQKTRVLRRNGKGPEPKTEDCESFFNFFKSPRIPKDGEEELDEDAAEEVQNKLEQDYDMACTLRDKIVPHAVSWFTGEAAIRVRDDWPDDDDEEDNVNENANENANENEEDEDEDEDDEDEDDEDDDDEDEVITDMKESAAEVSHLQHCERPPECIQQ